MRKKEEWMLIEPETLTIEDWVDYQNKKCLCNARTENECACGSWADMENISIILYKSRFGEIK